MDITLQLILLQFLSLNGGTCGIMIKVSGFVSLNSSFVHIGANLFTEYAYIFSGGTLANFLSVG